MKTLFIFLFTAVLCLNLHAQSVHSQTSGKGMFTYQAYQPFADRPVDVHYYIPDSADIRQMPIVFVFEGADRKYSYLLETWKQEAEKYKFMVFIPHFDAKDYPVASYQETGVMDKSHTIVHPEENLTPMLIDKMFEYVRKQTGSQRKGYRIYGHSAGGQFVQRFMLFHDSPYIEKAIIGSPGWYTFPDTNLAYPYGVGNIPYITPERIKKYLAKPIILQLGTGDTIRESYLRKTPEADLQGRNRYERGQSFFQYLHQLSTEHNWVCNWKKIEEEDVGHVSTVMGHKIAPILANDSLRALFIGNSYTFYNDLIYQIQALAASCGQKLSVKKIAYGGWTLKQHATNPQTLNALQEGSWDFVVLQEQSKAPAREKEWVREHVYSAAATLDSMRRLYSPQGKTVLYMTWGHNTDNYQQMQQSIAQSYLEMSKQLNARCAPVGIAWKRIREEHPKLSLYNPDRSHPSTQGSYLAANVLFSTFFGKSYQSTYYAGLPKEEALYLQNTSQEVVLSNLIHWNICHTAQPKEVTHHFYPAPTHSYSTPTLNKPIEESIASFNEIQAYLQQLVDKYPKQVTMTSIGTTPQGRNIPILYFGTKRKNKTRVWIQAGLHGNEPAGTEATCILTDYLLRTSEGNELLKHINLALVPIANADGYAIQQRNSSSGYDLNRDQSKLTDPVSLLLKKAYCDWNPEVALDIHEYNPIRKEFASFHGNPAAIANDVLFLPSGHLNIPPSLRQLSNGIFRQEAEQALASHNYQTGFYFTPTFSNDTLYAVKDGRSPQSSSTFQALSNAISLFIEIRGIGLDRSTFARRAECGYLVARSILQTAALHKKQIKKVLCQATKETISRKNDICVTFDATRTAYSIPFIDLVRNTRFEAQVPTLDAMQLHPTLTRKRPKAYILPASCELQVEKLRAMGIEVRQTQKPLKAVVEKYIVTNLHKSDKKWEKIHPISVSTRLITEKRLFPAGSFILSLAQEKGNLLVTILEPESANGFVNFGVIQANTKEELPIYRQLQ